MKKFILTVTLVAAGLLGALHAAQPVAAAKTCCHGSTCCDGGGCCVGK